MWQNIYTYKILYAAYLNKIYRSRSLNSSHRTFYVYINYNEKFKLNCTLPEQMQNHIGNEPCYDLQCT